MEGILELKEEMGKGDQGRKESGKYIGETQEVKEIDKQYDKKKTRMRKLLKAILVG